MTGEKPLKGHYESCVTFIAQCPTTYLVWMAVILLFQKILLKVCPFVISAKQIFVVQKVMIVKLCDLCGIQVVKIIKIFYI